VTQRGPRVLHVISALGVGGVEVWLIALLRYMREQVKSGEQKEEFHIILTGGKPAELDELAASLGARLHYIRFSRSGYTGFARQFRKLLERERFDVIHDQQDYSAAWRLLAGAGILPPVRIVHVHNPPFCLRVNTETRAQKIVFGFSRAIVKRFATHVLGTSAQVLREYGFTSDTFPKQIIEPLHCGFEVSAFAMSSSDANDSVCDEFSWPRRSRITLFAGRLDGFDPRRPDWNHKNPEFALDVVHRAIENGTEARMIVVGDGDKTRRLLEKRVQDWGIADRIRFAGRRMDMARLMAASHVCLFPSLEEGLGMVAVEAQAAGVRVLASDTVPREAAAVSDLVTFLPLSDGADSWARELARLLALPRMDSDAAANQVRATDFSIDRSYARLHRIYASSLSSRRQ
jgi:glycosyltransferase involved in cell wall biosynthesis